jgi:aminoglycoside phosphotransferase (APT) family kinase protein
MLKARRLPTATDVERVKRLSALLDPRWFPPVVAHHGCALLTAWIPGSAIGPHGWTPARVRVCGRLQATIHRLAVPGRDSRGRRPADRERRLDRFLRELVGGHVLHTARAREVRRLAVATAPSNESTGVCHKDFCGENVILSDAGELCVIDNEAIGVDAREYDLARTWYRWPMTPSQQRAYADGYGAHEHVARFAAHFLYWALIVVVESAAFRTRVGVPSVRVPVARLTELLRGRGRGELFPRLLRGR